MRRIGRLYERICDRDNLRLAWVKARRGKADRPDVRRFGAEIDAELAALEASLRARRWDVGHYSHFTIHDPKERLITAAPFRERVLHHAVMNVCEPCFEKWQLDPSHACRKGRGLDTALAAARRYARAYPWYLKLDVRKYFDSIPHDRLLGRLERRFKDPNLMMLFSAILETYETPASDGFGASGGASPPGEPPSLAVRPGAEASPRPQNHASPHFAERLGGDASPHLSEPPIPARAVSRSEI